MENQKLQLSRQTQIGIPEKWQEKFLIKRIDEGDIEISLKERDAILQALNTGQRFIQVGKYTLMLNGIKSIDPKWGANNIPSRPDEKKETSYIKGSDDRHEYVATEKITNQKELDEWDKYFNQ